MSESTQEQEPFFLPDIHSPEVGKFIDTLLGQKRLSAQGQPPRSQAIDHQPCYVATINNDYPPLQCWFNCIDFCIRQGGVPVFGWLIWRLENPSGYVAQHHAVVNTGSELLDVTHGDQYDKVLFVPDSVTPFTIDTDPMYLPANFYADESGLSWQAFDSVSTDFYLLKMSPDSSHLDLVTRAKKQNIL